MTTEEPKDEEILKKVSVPRTATDVQRFRLQKLLKNPEKPVFIPEKPEERLPRVFRPPEFVRNIWGSSAGAGSGDFHVYRGVRRREYARQKFLDEKSDKQKLDEKFQERLIENKAAAITRTAKKRAKRQKKKMKQKAKKPKHTENSSGNNKDEDTEESEKEESDLENQEAICNEEGNFKAASFEESPQDDNSEGSS